MSLNRANNNQSKRTNKRKREDFDLSVSEKWDILKFNNQERKLYNNYKKLKISSFNFMENNGWISATSVKNYVLNDPLIDWLDRYYYKNKEELCNVLDDNSKRTTKKRRIVCPLFNKNKVVPTNLKKSKKNSSLNLLFTNGKEFEKKVMDYLTDFMDTNFNKRTVTVFTDNDWENHKKSQNMTLMKEKMNETVKYMNDGIPIIFQGVLMNSDNYTYGMPDILIRSDFINNIFTVKLEDESLNISAPNLDTSNYHYRVIDIKWTTIALCANGLNLRNEDRIPAYKSQLAIYNSALGKIQGYTPSVTYILGKAWRIDRRNFPERGYSCIDRLGVIDYDGFDEKYIQLTKDAINWVHKVSSVGHTWKFNNDNPDVPEMYPNMCNKNDTKWFGVKSKIADKYDEITRVWYLNVKHRNTAHSNNIFRTSDENCTTDNLGIKGGSRKYIIESILDTNRSDKLINYDKNDLEVFKDWFEPNLGNYYVDFETLNNSLGVSVNNMDILDSKTDGDMAFMIGLGFSKERNISTNKVLKELKKRLKGDNRCGILNKQSKNWEYICFYMENKDDKQEINVYKSFILFIKEREKLINSLQKNKTFVNNKLFHWTGAEPQFMEHSRNKVNFNDDRDINKLLNYFDKACMWYDMYELFTKLPITIKNCYNFKLKSVAKAMLNNNLITTGWKENGVGNGLTAMITAIEIYNNLDKNNSNNLKRNKTYKSIIDYNEIDCKVLWDISNYLRDDLFNQSSSSND
jgi:hypothetical protein